MDVDNTDFRGIWSVLGAAPVPHLKVGSEGHCIVANLWSIGQWFEIPSRL